LLLIAVSNYWMSRMNLDISPDQVICLGPAWSFSTLIHACDTGWRSVDK
jgi:hypothetical protein